MKKTYIYILLIAISLILFTGCKNDQTFFLPDKEYKMNEPYLLGDTIYLENANEKYFIKETNEEFVNGLYVNKEYCFCNEGEHTFTIINEKGNEIKKVKACTLHSEPKYITLDYLPQNDSFYLVGDDEYNINITSLNASKQFSFCITIPETHKHLIQLTFENVTINNKGIIPIIVNLSKAPIVCNIKGTVDLYGGEAPLITSHDQAQQIINGLKPLSAFCEKINNVIESDDKWNNFKAFMKENELVEESGNVVYDVLSQSSGVLLNLAKHLTTFVDSLLDGAKGGRGIDGVVPISSVGYFYIRGDGKLYVSGSDGGKGANGGSALASGGNGGTGGKGAAAFYCSSLFINDSLKYQFERGKGGDGGEGGSSFLLNDGKKGYKGEDAKRFYIGSFHIITN